MGRNRFGRTPGQGVLMFTIVLFFVSIFMTYTLYNFSDLLIQSVLPPGYVLTP